MTPHSIHYCQQDLMTGRAHLIAFTTSTVLSGSLLDSSIRVSKMTRLNSWITALHSPVP